MRRWLLCVALLVALPGFWKTARMDAASQNPANQNPKHASEPQEGSDGHPSADTADYVGQDTCAICHSDLEKNFSKNPHSRLALMHGGKGVTCESCHGPGKAHVDSGGDPTKIFRFTTAPAQQIDAKCLDCHVGDHPNFDRTSHGEAGISCASCHSVHAFQTATSMLRAPQPALCYTCHTDVRAAFALPFHHKVDEGLMQCTDCHDPHGTFEDKLLKTTAAQNAVCVSCHTENAGPFVYEHPPVKVEGCTSCHFPHGSPNPRLLTRSTTNSLCLQCHSASMNFTAPGTPSFHNLANQYQACTICHTQIHGSNASNFFFK